MCGEIKNIIKIDQIFLILYALYTTGILIIKFILNDRVYK
jgi:hypothetical protein